MIEFVLDGTIVLPPIRSVAVVSAAVAKITQQLWTKRVSEHRIYDPVSSIVAEMVLCPSRSTGGACNPFAVCDACQVSSIVFTRARGPARASSSHLLPALRWATTIAVKGYRSFGRSPSNDVPARSGEIHAGVQSESARRPRRTGAM